MFALIFKKLTGFDPAAILIAIFVVLLAIIVIPNYERVAGFFGYETRAVLKEKANVAKNNLEIAEQTNKENGTTIAIAEKNQAAVEIAIVDKIKIDKLILKSSDTIKVKKKKVIEKVTEDTSKTDDQKVKEISIIQITSIWDAYCAGNTNAQCSSNQGSS